MCSEGVLSISKFLYNLFHKLMIHTNNIFSKLLINSCGRQQVLKCEGNVDQMLRLRSLRIYIMSLYIV